MYRRRDYRQEICPCFGCSLRVSSGELDDHLKSHPDASSYFCRLCFLVFQSQATYLHHVSGGQCNRGKHGYAACGVAGCAFRGTFSSLESHYIHTHGAPSDNLPSVELTCRACSSKFYVLIDFLIHLANDCHARTRRATKADAANSLTQSMMEPQDTGRRQDPSAPENEANGCVQRIVNELTDSTLMEHLTEHGFAAVQCGYCPATATTMSGILLHLCYCHADVNPKFLIRDNDLEEKFHSGRGAWTICRNAMLENFRFVEFQQRCYCCLRMLTGFRELKIHMALEHQLSPVPEELADRLFTSYDYTVAVQKGRCPFCSFVAEDSVALQEHVLYQELQCIDVRHQSDDIWRRDKDDSRLLAWAEANLCFQRRHYVCPECLETFDTTSNLGLHVRRHYVYYPVTCKLCGSTLRGLVSRDRHMLQEHGLKDSKSEHCGLMPEDVSAKVQEVISRQKAGLEEHGCEQCGFKSRSSSYIKEHRLRCSIIAGNASELPLPFKCCVCRTAFSLLCPLLEHGFWQHGFSYFCADCYFGADDEGALRKGGHPCRGRDAFLVENKQQGSRLTARSALYISQLTVVKDWEVYYKSRDFEYEGLDRLYVQLYEQKVMVVDLLGVVNFEGYVSLCDVEV
ncbi:hypothetical protein IscW_ISCW012883 [Ixodes scapularis]|uniref:C2H2-type domain-containing protein n=1 Tax=Ixodes scapularis TaxID=6945 RepID=B7QFA3_IXOSC|nr:hypothetical protein IscW_ISCW012883 [Ixodes scapularis]|eukprot:XP_002414217.1 hypothetical protein IscW_ISCW012883 [Ixodes scapularis]